MAESLISQDLKVEGSIEAGQGTVVVAGEVVGDIKAGSVQINGGGNVNGAITAETVQIQGSQAGKVSCSELNLSASADVKSDVQAKSMISEKGAKLRGKSVGNILNAILG